MTLATSRESLASAAVRRDVDLLVDVGAVEPQRVEAGLALDRVAGIAGVPDERVIARAERCHVVSGAAYDDVSARAAGDRVIAGAALIGEIDLPGVDAEAFIVSFPAPPLTRSGSLPGSAPVMVTRAANPLTTTDEPLLAMLMWSLPAVPLTVTVSAAPSP